MSGQDALQSSFRDPAGFLYKKNQTLYRQINSEYADDYDLLMNSGLYAALVKTRLLVPHEEVELGLAATDQAYKVIRPDVIDYISYPYEWCFSQLQDAALVTIKIQRIALKFGMVLKDASAYNIQFHKGAATFIDTLSFSQYREGEPWVAYRQFCQQFIAPLALMSYTDIRLAQLLRNFIDGVPLDLASRLLPKRSYLKYSLLTHIHLHAKAQQKYANSAEENSKKQQMPKIGRKAYMAFLQGIHSSVKGLKWKQPATEWAVYYSATNYRDESMQHKEQLVEEYLGLLRETSMAVHDLGANNGHFSRIGTKLGFSVIAQDIDPVAVQLNYLQSKENKDSRMLPLLLDLTNPSPSIGWSLQERMSLMERIDGEIVMALALIHHLAISNNVPLRLIARFFSNMAEYLIIEFVPKNDSQVKRLLASRKDIFVHYTQDGFEKAFAEFYATEKQSHIQDSERTLYLMKRRASR